MESYKIENNRKEVFFVLFLSRHTYFNNVCLEDADKNFDIQFELTGLEPIFVGFAGFDTSIQNSDVFVEPKKSLRNQYFSDFTFFLIALTGQFSNHFADDLKKINIILY